MDRLYIWGSWLWLSQVKWILLKAMPFQQLLRGCRFPLTYIHYSRICMRIWRTYCCFLFIGEMGIDIQLLLKDMLPVRLIQTQPVRDEHITASKMTLSNYILSNKKWRECHFWWCHTHHSFQLSNCKFGSLFRVIYDGASTFGRWRVVICQTNPERKRTLNENEHLKVRECFSSHILAFWSRWFWYC